MIRRLTAFAGLSAFSFALNLGTTCTLVEIFGLSPELAFSISLVLVVFVNFTACRWLVFRSTEKPIIVQLFQFLVSTVFFRCAEAMAFVLLQSLQQLPYAWTATGVLVASFCVKFVFYRIAVFSTT